MFSVVYTTWNGMVNSRKRNQENVRVREAEGLLFNLTKLAMTDKLKNLII
jgi:hypothetical protein